MEDQLQRTQLAELLERAALATRLAVTINGDPAAPRLLDLAEELDAEIVRLSRQGSR